MKSIQSKILTVVIAGLLVITAIVSVIAVNMTHEIMHNDADRILKNATQKEAAQINDVLGDVVKSSNIMRHYFTTNIHRASDFKDADFCAEYLEKAEIMFSEVALNTSGIAGFYIRINPEFQGGTTGFYKTITAENTLKDMPVTDLNKYDEDDTKNVGWYYKAIANKDGIWLDPYRFPGTEGELITFAQPIYINDILIGVIGFDMDFSYLISRINEIHVYEYGYAALLAKDGVTCYNTTPVLDSGSPHTESKVELKNGMFLVMHADYKDIQKDIHPLLSRIVFAFVAVLVGSILYTVFVTKKIVGPLKRLTAVAESITEGSLTENIAMVTVDTKDEIGTLSNSLNNTYSKIQEYTTYINALAYRDSLTGIKNSTAYTEAITKLNQEILTGNPKFGVLVADINNLKQTNDTYGHDVGNNLIVHTAKILSSTFANSAVYRIGGDEFAVILQGDDYTHYHSLLEKMDKACAQEVISVCEANITVSVARGIALYDPDIDNVYEDVFSKADQAMYLNKDQVKLTCV